MPSLTLTAGIASSGSVEVKYEFNTGASTVSSHKLELIINDVTEGESGGSPWFTNSVDITTDLTGKASGSFIQDELVNGVEYIVIGNVDNVYSNNISIVASSAPIKPIVTVSKKTTTSAELLIDTGVSQGLPILGGTVFMKQHNSRNVVITQISSEALAHMENNVITMPVSGLLQDVPYECFVIVKNGSGSSESATIRFTLSTMLDAVSNVSTLQNNGSLQCDFTLPSLNLYETITRVSGLVTNRTATGVSFKCQLSLAAYNFSQELSYTPVLAPGSYALGGALQSDRTWSTTGRVTFTIPTQYRQFVSNGNFKVKITSLNPNPNNIEYLSRETNVTVSGVFGTDLTLPKNSVAITTVGSYATTPKINLATKLYFDSAAELNSFNGANTGFVSMLGSVPPSLTINARWVDTTEVAPLAEIPANSVTIGSSAATAVAFNAEFAEVYFGKQMKLQLQSVSGVTSSPFVDANVSRYIQAAPELVGALSVVNSEYLNNASFLLNWSDAKPWGTVLSNYNLYQVKPAAVAGGPLIYQAYPNPSSSLQLYISSDAAGVPLVQSTTYTFAVEANGMDRNTSVSVASNKISGVLAFGKMYIKDQVMQVTPKSQGADLRWVADYTQISWINYPVGNANYLTLAQQQGYSLTTQIGSSRDLLGATPFGAGNSMHSLSGLTNGESYTYYFRQSVTILGDTYYSEIQSFTVTPRDNIALTNAAVSYTYNAIAPGVGSLPPVTSTVVSTATLAQVKSFTSANAANIKSVFSVDVTRNGGVLSTYAVIGVPGVADASLMSSSYVSGNAVDKMTDPLLPDKFSVSFNGIYSAAIIQISGSTGGKMIVIPTGATLSIA